MGQWEHIFMSFVISEQYYYFTTDYLTKIPGEGKGALVICYVNHVGE